MNTKLHAVTDTSGRPIRLFITAGQVSDYTGAAALMNSLPEADWLLADRGYDADWFRETLVDKALHPRSQVAQKDCQVRQAPLQTTQPYRDNVRQAQGLATHLNPLRQIPNRLPLCNCSRSSRYLVVMSPDPRHLWSRL